MLPVLDPRFFQIVFLGLLLSAGAFLRDFSILPAQVALTFLSCLLTQAVGIRALGLKRIGYMSAVITGLSLSLLLRADTLWAHPLASILAIGSKFVVRYRGKHICNPGNLGVILGLTVLPGSWVSPGQWGHDAAFACWFVALGAAVVWRARRSDVSWLFLLFYLGAVACRVVWLGQRWAVWLHQLESGALLLFAFFMISDPMTIPNRRGGRVLYAALVAGLAFCWQYGLFRTNGLLWALFLMSPLVPLIDRLLPAQKYEWTQDGGDHEPRDTDPGRAGGPLLAERA